jgi:hypothetical protein
MLVRRDSVSGNLVDKDAALSMLDLVETIENVNITYGGNIYTFHDVISLSFPICISCFDDRTHEK